MATEKEVIEKIQALGDGVKDLKNLTLSMGLHAMRESLNIMVEEFAPENNIAEIMQGIKDISPVTEIGCMQVDFFNNTTGAPDKVYIVLDRCPRDHDLDAQFARLKPHVSADKWTEVCKSFSMLIFIGRSVYSQESRKNIKLIQKIIGVSDDSGEHMENVSQYLDYKIDPANTTLCLDNTWSHRIGIYIRDEST
jgi:hypothetical protein